MKLLTELHSESLQLIEEGIDKKHYLRGLMLEFDGTNRNGRIYRSEYHDAAVMKYIKEKVDDGRGWGELDHPEGATINLKNVSHRVVEMHKEGQNWYGKSIITDTPLGQTVKGLLESGGKLGSSSRGVGSLKQVDEGMEVQKDLRFITVSDIVSDPSAHGALMNGIMENVEFFFDETNGTFVAEKANELKNEIKKMTLKEIEDRKVRMFAEWIESMKKGSF